MKKLILLLISVIIFSCEGEKMSFELRFKLHCPLAFKYAYHTYYGSYFSEDLFISNEESIRDYCDCYLQELLANNSNNTFINGDEASYKPFVNPNESLNEVVQTMYSTFQKEKGYQIDETNLDECLDKMNLKIKIDKQDDAYIMIINPRTLKVPIQAPSLNQFIQD